MNRFLASIKLKDDGRPNADNNRHRTFLPSLLIPLLLVAAQAAEQRTASPPPVTRAEREEFLSKADIVSDVGPASGGRRVTLDDGQRKHAAAVESSTSRDPSQRDYRSNLAAYELDKVLDLNLVVPSVERRVNGQPAAITWWIDDVLMNELSRRENKIEPPDLESWNKYMQVVRVFDELIANAYRDINPASYTSRVWDNLLITREWRIWLIDHTRTFATIPQLEHPESLTQCDRAMLRRLRQLNKEILKQHLGNLLTGEQLDALEARRVLIVRHFDEQIATKGEGAVLYDLARRQ